MGTLVDSGVEGVAELDLLRPLGELGQELVVDLRVDEDTRASAARLAVVPADHNVNELETKWKQEDTHKIP